MKNFFLIAFVFMIFTSCNNDSEDNPLPAYTVEGKWLWSPDPEDRTSANTMFEFLDGNVYTSYASTGADFNALDATDRIPGFDTYTFDGNTLIWDEISRTVSFECDGGIMLNENSYKLWRLSSDCN
ncbi:hypothetical protein N9E92_05340 [Polaribacter sp.]|nr:hypothetical protein [Polaribacter sp.]